MAAFGGLRRGEGVIGFDETVGPGAVAHAEEFLLLGQRGHVNGLRGTAVFPVGLELAQHSLGLAMGAPGPLRNQDYLPAFRAIVRLLMRT